MKNKFKIQVSASFLLLIGLIGIFGYLNIFSVKTTNVAKVSSDNISQTEFSYFLRITTNKMESSSKAINFESKKIFCSQKQMLMKETRSS